MNNQNIRRLTGLLICAGAVVYWQANQDKNASAPLPEIPAKPTAVAPLVKPSQTSPLTKPQNFRATSKFQVFNDSDATPVWMVKYGGEFWRHRNSGAVEEASSAKASTLINPPFSLGDVIERVNHAFDTDSADGFPQISAGNYSARFDAQGLEFSPSKPTVVSASKVSMNSEDGASDSQKSSPVLGSPVADPTTEVLFQTASIGRDGQVLFSADQNPVQWSVIGNTVQGLLSPSSGIVEHYEAGNNGMEVSWVFPEALPGSGNIEISATVSGLSYAGETDMGLHFADSSGVARVYVGRAEAVDSLGNRWDLTTYAVGKSGQLVVELPAAVQDEAVYPLVVDPIIGPEFGLNQPVSTAASGDQQNAAVASGAGMFFVAWEDQRNSGSTATDIYGTRVSNAGAILDPFGISIAAAAGLQSTPSVAASGATFLVTWQDERLGGDDIFGARIASKTGAVLDPLGFAISFDPTQAGKANPSVAGSPSGFFVAWEDNRNNAVAGSEIFGARVTSAGVVVDPAGVGISTNPVNQFHPTVVFDNTDYFVAWEDDRNNPTTGRDIYGGRVGTNGVVIDFSGVPLCTVSNSQTTPVAAFNSGTVLVAWRDRRTSGKTSDDIFGTRVNFTNDTVNVLDPLGIAISTNSASQKNPSVCAFTNGFLAVWADSRNNGATGTDIYGARVDTNGNVLDLTGLPICTNANNQANPAVAANSSGALVVWTDPNNFADTGNDILGTRISNLGVVEDTNNLVISRSGSQESSPAVAFNGTNYLVVWQDERNFITNSTDILGARVSATGSVLDPHGLNICTQPTAQQHPSVGASGGEFLVAWEDARNDGTDGIDIYGTRVNGGGAVLDPAGLLLSAAANDQLTPVVAGNSSTFLVAWEDNQNNPTAPDIYGTLVSQSGLISNPGGFPIAATGGNEVHPAIAANSNQFLVAFEETGSGDVFATRVANNGTVLDPGGSALQLAGQGSESFPSVASLGTNYLVAWMDSRNFASGLDIFGGRVIGDGSTPDANNDGFPICTMPNNQVNPAVGADANTSTYVVVWQNQGTSDGNDLYSARVGVNGSVLDFWTTPLAGTGDRTVPQLAYGGAGKFLLVSDTFRTNSSIVSGSILNGAPPTANLTVQFSSAIYSVAGNGKFAKVTVKVTGKYTGEVTVDLATADGSGVANVDYMPVAGTLVFSSKKTSATALIPIIDSGAGGPNKTVNLILQNPTGGVLIGSVPTATLTILE